jgi:sugar lactone lactonase YvrE
MIKGMRRLRAISLMTAFLFLGLLGSESFSQNTGQSQSEAAKLVQAGKGLYDDGEYKEAIIKLFEGLRLAKAKEDVSEACLYLSLSYYALGDTPNCLANLKKLFEVEPRRSVDESYFPSGFMALFNKTKDEVAKQAATKLPEKVEEKKIEEKKAGEKTAEEKKAEEKKAVKEEKPPTVEKPKEEEKKPVAVGGKPTQETQVKKKKFPWLIVGGVVVAAGVLAVLLLKKKTSAPPSPQYGNISITSNPTGAQVYLDGVDQGKTTNCTLTNISVGYHTLKLELENYGKWEGSVTVVEGQTANISATLAGYRYEFVTKWGGQGSGDGQFNEPALLAVDGSGNIYVADNKNHRIQKFTSNGAFLTKFGSQGNGNGQFNGARGVAVDSSGNIYVTDSNHRIQKFNSNGTFLVKWGDYPEWLGPWGVAADNSGYIYVVIASYHRIEKYTSSGTFVARWGGVQGSGDGQFQDPYGIAVDGSGYVYVADSTNSRIQKFTSDGTFLTKWGSTGSQDGQFRTPDGVAVDSSGFVYVADKINSRVQKFTSSGTFMTKWGTTGSGDGQFIMPDGVAVDNSGYVYVSDSLNHRIQKFRMTTQTQQQARISFTPMNGNPLKFAPLPGPERMDDSLLKTEKDSQNLPIKKRERDKN